MATGSPYTAAAMILALFESFGVLAYVGLVIFGVVRLCRFDARGAPLHIDCARAIDDSVVALSACCMPAAPRSLVSQWMAGSVSRGSARLERRVRGRQNSFGAVFSGDFRERGARVVLVGEFGMAACTQGFLMLWCGGVGLALFAGLYGGIVQGHPAGLTLVAIAAALLLACWGLVRFGKAWAADDIRWMTGVVREALA